MIARIHSPSLTKSHPISLILFALTQARLQSQTSSDSHTYPSAKPITVTSPFAPYITTF